MAEKVLTISNAITVGELAEKLDLPAARLVGELFKNGIAATINQKIDFDTAQIIIEELGLDVELEEVSLGEALDDKVKESRSLSDKAESRPPIVAVMGHVDHGKTTLLDSILGAKVAKGEAGGITQHISAYQVERNKRKITLLDTPGHEAFAALRQHGATLTDVVVIVVAADDGVKPQTVEAIKFAQAANAKMVIAINKIDKPTADSNLVKTQLANEHKLNPEEWGGDTVMVEVSAKTGQNIDKLLDMVLLVADLEDLKAEVDVSAEGLVIESHLEQGRGTVASLLVEHGNLEKGQYVVAGDVYGKIRTLNDFLGKSIPKAGPATPATITGLKMPPQFGDTFQVVENEKIARQQSSKQRADNKNYTADTSITGTDLLRLMNKKRDVQEMNVVIKVDVQGSLTSIKDSLRLLENDELVVRIVGSGVGNITERDVSLAAGSGAAIYGFNVQLSTSVKRLAKRDKVPVKLFNVIYELLDDARSTLESLLQPEVVEEELGKLIIKGIFRSTRNLIICGGEVTKGKITPGSLARIKRDDEVIAEAEVTTVQRQQQEVKEVFEGEMCGLSLKISNKLEILEGDKLEIFKRELKQRKLS